MNETTYIYIVHSDINENNIYAEFASEEEAIEYAKNHADELTYVDKVEAALDEDGEIIEIFDGQTIWVYDELDDLEVVNDEEDFFAFKDEIFEEDYDELVETLEENEDVVECKECFELFPKLDCTKLEVGYICPCCYNSKVEPASIIVVSDEDENSLLSSESEDEEQDVVEPVVEVENEAAQEVNETDDTVEVEEEEVTEDYTGTPEERTDHLEYIDKDQFDGKAELPKNITKVEDDHCEKVNSVINHTEDEKEVLTEEPELVDTRKKGYHSGEPIDYTDPVGIKRLDVLLSKVRRHGPLTTEAVRKIGSVTNLVKNLNCNSLEEVENLLDPYFEYLPGSIYNRGVEAYDEIVCELPRILWELKTGKEVDREGIDEELTEQTHAQFAKPEGDRVAAYNNALKYAKQYNADFIYGYTNHAGKFFALEQPIKASDVVGEAEKDFRNKYKNCSAVYVAYPDKAFLKEGVDELVECGWCGDSLLKSECKVDVDLGYLCSQCQEELISRGEELIFEEQK